MFLKTGKSLQFWVTAQVACINHAQPEPFPAALFAAHPHICRRKEHRTQVSCPHTSH